MNNGLTESENALNCIIENYINELQRNTCDDDEEDMRIYKEKMDYITSLKEIVLKDLKEENKKQKGILDILKHLVEIIPNNATDGKSLLNIRIKPFHIIDDIILLEIKEWLDEEE